MKPCKLKIGFLLPFCDEIEEEEPANYKQKISHYTVEPPNRGHFGTAAFVLSSEVVLFSEVV